MCWRLESVDPRFLHPMMGATWAPQRGGFCRWCKPLPILMKRMLLPIPTSYVSHTCRPNSKKLPNIKKNHQGRRWPRENCSGTGTGEVDTGHSQESMANFTQFFLLLTSSAVPTVCQMSLFLPFSWGARGKSLQDFWGRSSLVCVKMSLFPSNLYNKTL